MIDFSICMIVKNEEKTLDQCLTALSKLQSEIIIVDTGSTDRTREITRKHNAKLYDFTWCNDFSAARNYCISKASHDAILIVDADEILQQSDFTAMQTAYQKNPEGIGRFIRCNYFERNEEMLEYKERVGRLINRTKYSYQGRIHEQPVRKDGRDSTYYPIPLTFSHEGYNGTKEEIQSKADRNITLLLGMLQEKEDPYIFYQLGKSYYMKGEYSLACDYFNNGLSFDLNENLEYVQDMVESYGYSLINTGQFSTALHFEGIYDAFARNSDFVFLMGLIYMNNGRFEEAIEQFQKATTMMECRVTGTNGVMAYYNIGVIYECCGDLSTASQYYMRCQDYPRAVKRLAEM